MEIYNGGDGLIDLRGATDVTARLRRDNERCRHARNCQIRIDPALAEGRAISTDTALLKKGAYATAVVGCSGCHFNDWKGFSANPRVGGQSTAYLAAHDPPAPQRSRANSPGMSDLVRTLDEGDIDAVAAYLNAAQ